MPTETIGNNTGNTYTGTEECAINDATPTTNYSGSGAQYLAKNAGDHWHMLLRFPGIDLLPNGITVSFAEIQIEAITGSGGDMVFSLRRMLRDWSESQTTWNQYTTGNNWTTAGALGNGTDRSSTISGVSLQFGSTYTLGKNDAQFWADVQDMANGVVPNYGWHIERTDAQNDGRFVQIYASEDASTTFRPFLTVTYATGAAAGQPTIKRGRGVPGMRLGGTTFGQGF